MAWFIGQSLVFIVLAFILGVVAGRLWKNAPEKPVEPPVADDELERIEGVGPAMANALRAAGIRTFAQLAESGDDAKRNAIRTAGLSFAPSLATWSRQARLLADGDEAAFKILTTRLIAGRDTDPASRPTPKPTTRPTPTPTRPAAGTDSSSPEVSENAGPSLPAADRLAVDTDTLATARSASQTTMPTATAPVPPAATTPAQGSPGTGRAAQTDSTIPEARRGAEAGPANPDARRDAEAGPAKAGQKKADRKKNDGKKGDRKNSEVAGR